MVKFKEVDPNMLEDTLASRRGRVAYPILKEFLETGMFIAELDRTGMQQSMQSLYSSLTSYIRNHVLPVRILSRKGRMYLMRLDVDSTGNAIENWQQEALGIEADDGEEPAEITPAEVSTRFAVEKYKSTK